MRESIQNLGTVRHQAQSMTVHETSTIPLALGVVVAKHLALNVSSLFANCIYRKRKLIPSTLIEMR